MIKALHVLFVSDAAGIRDHKMASIVKESGRKGLSCLYNSFTVWGMAGICRYMYEEIFAVMSVQSLYDFVKNSEFDIIHCSSELDHMTPVLMHSGKTVIHDCHDLRSSNESLSPDRLAIEYLAHTGAAGVIYPTCGLRDEAVRKFGLSKERTLVVENYPFKDLLQKKKKKRSVQQMVKFTVYMKVE